MSQNTTTENLLPGGGWTIRNMVTIALSVFTTILIVIIFYLFDTLNESQKQSDSVSAASENTAVLMGELGSQISALKTKDLVLLLEAQNLVTHSKAVDSSVFLYVNQFTEDAAEMHQSYQQLAASISKLEKLWPQKYSRKNIKLLIADAQVIEDVIVELEETSSPSQLEEMSEDVSSFTTSLVERSTLISIEFAKKIEVTTESIQLKSDNTLVEAENNGERAKVTSKMMTTLKTLLLWTSLIILIFVISFWFFINNIITKPIKKIVDCINQLAKGDLTTRCDLKGKTELVKLTDSLNSMGQNLHQLVSQVFSIGEDVAESSHQVKEFSEQSSNDMLSQNAETDQIATAIEKLTSSSNSVVASSDIASINADKVSIQAATSSSLVKDVTISIKQLAGKVDNATGVINQLADETSNIGLVLDVIHGISEQTNSLALNAAIEAARAGEQGRGFAVVADEVRTLASRTQDSTEEIQKMIQSLKSGAQNAVNAMDQGKKQAGDSVNKAGEAMSQFQLTTDTISNINELNHNISTSSNKQKSVIVNIEKNVYSISNLSESTTQGAQNTVTAANKLNQLAIDLSTTISSFKLK